MKNSLKYIFYLIILTFINQSIICAEEFDFRGSEIEIVDNGNILKASDGVEVFSDNDIQIKSEKFIYYKTKRLLVLTGSVTIFDKSRNLKILGEEFFYDKSKEQIYSKLSNTILFNNEYTGITKELFYNIEDSEIFSNKKIILKDQIGNEFFSDNFEINLNKNIFKSDNIKFIDINKNNYFLEKTFVNLETKELIGKDVKIDFEKSLFGNNQNDPRLKGNSVSIDKNFTNVSKGIFTTCKKTDKCPPWSLSAEKVTHDKKKQIISYKNAWLKVYDAPIFYFPKFFHPDPTVKRQSGFLVPTFGESTSLGSSLETPYYHVISDNKDLTFKPRFYTDKNMVLNTEYRQANKNSDHIVDFSINQNNGINLKGSDRSKTHFFSNSSFDFENDIFDSNNLKINVEQTSNNTYLKTYKFDSEIINNLTTLNSFLKYEGINEDLFFDASVEVFEDLAKEKNSDKYEYIFPNIQVNKIFSLEQIEGDLSLQSSGNNKQYDTNITESSLINNLTFNSYPSYIKNGIVTDYSLILKNINTNSKNSSKYKEDADYNLKSAGMFNLSYPLRKTGELYNNFFTPKLSLRYSPSNTKNIKDENRRIDINNVYSFDRIQSNDTVEGGQSLTLGSNFSMANKDNVNLFEFNLATVYRDEENLDLPVKSTLGQKSSNVFGKVSYKPSKFFNLDYNFSLDNSLNRSNYDYVKTEFTINNFVNSFEYLEENEEIGDNGYWSNKSTFNFNNSNSLSFNKRRNIKTGLDEFYNLMYQYKNDCLTAAIQYNKEYYTDSELQPSEEIFFSLTIVPFSKTNSPNLK